MRKKNISLYAILLIIPIVATFQYGCRKLIEVDMPATQLPASVIFENDETALSAIAGLYVSIQNMISQQGTSVLAGLSADELKVADGKEYSQLFDNEIATTNTLVASYWKSAYSTIYLCNSIIEGLEKSPTISEAVKKQLTGEALFIRAFIHYNIGALFGNVPYITDTNYQANSLKGQSDISTILVQLEADLKKSKDLLAIDYSYSKGERVRVNKWAASALLSRIYLYFNDWTNAELFASDIIGEKVLYSITTSPNDVFLKNSREAIWQLIPPSSQNYTSDGSIFIQPGYLAASPVASDHLVNSFDKTDLRFVNWLKKGSGTLIYYYPNKYKENSSDGSGKEYSMMLRLAEQYLIRAEARAHLNKLAGANSALSDVNIIRHRAGLSDTSATDIPQILNIIQEEKRHELFTEWGNRWFDLKRTGRAIQVLHKIKSSWNNTDTLYPIPQVELLLNPNLKQNDGY